MFMKRAPVPYIKHVCSHDQAASKRRYTVLDYFGANYNNDLVLYLYLYIN